MTCWTFREYVTEEGINLIRRWYAEQDDQVRAEFDVTIRILKGTESWLDPEIDEFKLLTGAHAGLGLGEIRFSVEVKRPGAPKAKKRRFRPIGMYHETEREFILILGCEKFGMNTVPTGAFDLATRHKTEFDQKRGWTHDHF